MLTDKTAGRRERVVLPDQADRIGISSFFHERHITRNVHMGRTDRDTRDRLVVCTGTSAFLDVLHIVIAVADQPLIDHVRRLIADRTVRGIHDGKRRLLHEIQRIHCRFSV